MVVTILQVVLLPVLAFAIGVFFLGLYRRIMARIHWRYGPPLIQPVIDVVRLFFQHGVSHGAMFDLGLVASLAVERLGRLAGRPVFDVACAAGGGLERR